MLFKASFLLPLKNWAGYACGPARTGNWLLHGPEASDLVKVELGAIGLKLGTKFSPLRDQYQVLTSESPLQFQYTDI